MSKRRDRRDAVREAKRFLAEVRDVQRRSGRTLGGQRFLSDTTRRRTWSDKPPEQERAFRGNRRRVRGRRGRRLQRQRSAIGERGFAHTCETGGGRRSWLRGLVNVAKRYVIQGAAHNLGVLMRKLTGVGTPRSLQGASAAACAALSALISIMLPSIRRMNHGAGVAALRNPPPRLRRHRLAAA